MSDKAIPAIESETARIRTVASVHHKRWQFRGMSWVFLQSEGLSATQSHTQFAESYWGTPLNTRENEMKKVLLASTALVLTAGVAAADVSLGGSANFGLKYDGGATGDNTTLHYEVDFGISGSGTTDSGIAFGASIDLDQQIAADGNPTPTTDQGITDPEVFISGSFGTLTVGALDHASDQFGIADVGFDGIGVDDDADSLRGAGGAQANVTYEYVFGDVSFLVSYHTIEDALGVAVAYSGSQFSAGIGYVTDDSTGEDTITVDGSASFGDVTVGAIFSDWSGGASSFGVEGSYSTGATTITAVYGTIDTAGNDDDYGIGVAYDLGGGAELAGGIGSVNGETKADLGLNLSF